MTELASYILTGLEAGSTLSAGDLTKALLQGGFNCDKKSVNSTLYSLLKEGKVVKTEGTPPLWSLPVLEEKETGPITIIFIRSNADYQRMSQIKLATNTVLSLYEGTDDDEAIIVDLVLLISKQKESTSLFLATTNETIIKVAQIVCDRFRVTLQVV
jgi:hypothetical protein